jgi:hypothetical protein
MSATVIALDTTFLKEATRAVAEVALSTMSP